MLFFVMVTLAEQKWIILRERQGLGLLLGYGEVFDMQKERKAL